MSFRIVATGLPVSVPFFAALDICEKPCWTDDPARAARFESQSDAELFAQGLTDDAWQILPA